jgi:hypothetical protein
MPASESRRRLVDAGVLRRLIHVAILIGLIVGVRTWGGAASAEDQLGAGTQWIAERTGLAAAKAHWDKSIRPPIAAVTNSTSDAFYRGIARTLDNAAILADQALMFIADTFNKAVDAVASSLRAMFLPGGETSRPKEDARPRPAPQPSPANP